MKNLVVVFFLIILVYDPYKTCISHTSIRQLQDTLVYYSDTLSDNLISDHWSHYMSTVLKV